MLEPTLNFWNAQAVDLPRLSLAPRQAGLFFGRFKGLVQPGRTNSEIGRGGSGVIHLVRDTVLERNVALKLPHDSILTEPQAKREVQNEASQALELTHPNIVRIYDFHDQDNRWGISMQYVRGKNLDEWRAKLAPHKVMGGAATDVAFYDVERIKDWIRQLCSALAYVHEEANIAHCDIKPKNLLLERSIDTTTLEVQERLVITDFGITQKLRNHTTRAHTRRAGNRRTGEEGEDRGGAGTLAYMSPQQLIGSDGTTADDIYALGITIYELLTGRPPFFQGEAEVIQRQIENTVPPSLSRRRAERGIRAAGDIPEEWERAVAACLAKNASDRPRSIAELAAMLGLSIEAAVPGGRPAVSADEVIVLQTTVTEQQALIIDQQAKMDLLARRVSSTIEENRAEVERLASERDAVINQHDALLGQVQSLDQERADLSRQLATLREAHASSPTEDVLSTLSERSARLANERDALAERVQRSDAELKKVQVAMGNAQAALEETQQLLDRSEGSVEKLQKDRATAVNATRAVEGKLAEVSKKVERSQEDLALAEKARRQATVLVDQMQAETSSLRHQLDTVHEKRTAPIKTVLLALTALMIMGAISGWVVGKFFGPSSDKELASLVEVAKAPPAEGILVTKKLFRVYLSQIGLSENQMSPEFQQLKDAQPAQGVSWLMAASFCEWLTEQKPGKMGAKDWFDLPGYEKLVELKPATPEWTRDDFIAMADKSQPQAAFRMMRIYDPTSKDRAAFRSDTPTGVGFRCVIRNADTK